MNVFVLRRFDGRWPARVAQVILAADRYEAMDKAADYWERVHGESYEDAGFEVAALMEADEAEDIYIV